MRLSKMASMKVRDINAALCRKGFISDRECDHVYYILYYNGKKTSVRTKISHSKNEIDDHLINAMSKQVHLDKENFFLLVECPLSEAEYKTRLLESGIISVK